VTVDPGRKTDRINGPRFEPLATPVVIREWKKNRGGDTIRVTLKSYKEINVIDLRTWFSEDGCRKPGKGFTSSVRQLPELALAVNAALTTARDLGLLRDDGEAEHE
jgi:hypothetical protein